MQAPVQEIIVPQSRPYGPGPQIGGPVGPMS